MQNNIVVLLPCYPLKNHVLTLGVIYPSLGTTDLDIVLSVLNAYIDLTCNLHNCVGPVLGKTNERCHEWYIGYIVGLIELSSSFSHPLFL